MGTQPSLGQTRSGVSPAGKTTSPRRLARVCQAGWSHSPGATALGLPAKPQERADFFNP